jgi:hypothetical protein
LGTTEYPEDAARHEVPQPPGDYQYARRIGRELPRLLERYMPDSWPPEPVELPAAQFLTRLGVFKRSDLIWIGNERDSGRSMYASHFRTLRNWLKTPPPRFWSFTCGAAFLPGTFSRSQGCVKATRLLILESDAIDARSTAALARWLEDEFSLPLLAMVHSGNESLHCYFPFPGSDWVATYRPALVEVGFDPRCLRAAQPMRLANQVRAGNSHVQQLFWLKPT